MAKIKEVKGFDGTSLMGFLAILVIVVSLLSFGTRTIAKITAATIRIAIITNKVTWPLLLRIFIMNINVSDI